MGTGDRVEMEEAVLFSAYLGLGRNLPARPRVTMVCVGTWEGRAGGEGGGGAAGTESTTAGARVGGEAAAMAAFWGLGVLAAVALIWGLGVLAGRAACGELGWLGGRSERGRRGTGGKGTWAGSSSMCGASSVVAEENGK